MYAKVIFPIKKRNNPDVTPTEKIQIEAKAGSSGTLIKKWK
jgi:hypothetical protein